MKATELRTGNILQYYIGEEGIEWEPTKIDWQDIKLCEEDNENFNKVYKPTPITKEWLLKFGFKKMTNYKSPNFDKYPIEVCFDGVKPLLTLEFDSTVTGSYSYDCPTEFVHQLQNLFFALTGEELKLIHE